MLIKITTIEDDQIYISESDIVLAKSGSYKETHCWRVETSGDAVWILPIDKNGPFRYWLDNQIGGDQWQKEVDRWKNIPDGCAISGIAPR